MTALRPRAAGGAAPERDPPACGPESAIFMDNWGASSGAVASVLLANRTVPLVSHSVRIGGDHSLVHFHSERAARIALVRPSPSPPRG
jgi:hypothetical protein